MWITGFLSFWVSPSILTLTPFHISNIFFLKGVIMKKRIMNDKIIVIIIGIIIILVLFLIDLPNILFGIICFKIGLILFLLNEKRKRLNGF